MALSVTADLSVRTCGRVAKNSTQGRGRVRNFSQETASEYGQIRHHTKNHDLIVLLYALRILEQFWVSNVYFVHHNNLLIKS